jgi:hypothetical protein
MSRSAILIEAGNARNQGKLLGAIEDVRRLREWLESNIGGAWNSDEIKVLSNPSPADVRNAVKEASNSSFSFVTFSGHGEITQDQYGTRRQKIIVGTGESMDLTELKPSSPKNVIICDSCRIVREIVQMSRTVKAALLLENRATRFQRYQYRERFDSAVANANPGTWSMYGCSPNQFSNEDPLNGGLFTISLITEGAKWTEGQDGSATLYVEEAFELAKSAVTALKSEQVPTGGADNRSGTRLPFVVYLK